MTNLQWNPYKMQMWQIHVIKIRHRVQLLDPQVIVIPCKKEFSSLNTFCVQSNLTLDCYKLETTEVKFSAGFSL